MSLLIFFFFFLMIRRPPRSTLDRSSAASDVYKRQVKDNEWFTEYFEVEGKHVIVKILSLIHISEPTRQAEISYAVFCLKKKKNTNRAVRRPTRKTNSNTLNGVPTNLP